MCLALLALDAVPGWPLVLAANRDERHERPAEALEWWPDRPDIVGGRDTLAGGSWLAVRRDGRYAMVLNDARVPPPAGARSRGTLVTDALGPGEIDDIAVELHARRDRHAGFHLLLGEEGRGWYLGSHVDHPRPLAAGIHAIGNAGFDPGSPRLRRARDLFETVLATRVAPEMLLDRLADTADPGTGEGDCRPVFIADEEFGTRCSTVLAIDDHGLARIHERRFLPGGREQGEHVRQWRIRRIDRR